MAKTIYLLWNKTRSLARTVAHRSKPINTHIPNHTIKPRKQARQYRSRNECTTCQIVAFQRATCAQWGRCLLSCHTRDATVTQNGERMRHKLEMHMPAMAELSLISGWILENKCIRAHASVSTRACFAWRAALLSSFEYFSALYCAPSDDWLRNFAKNRWQRSERFREENRKIAHASIHSYCYSHLLFHCMQCNEFITFIYICICM